MMETERKGDVSEKDAKVVKSLLNDVKPKVVDGLDTGWSWVVLLACLGTYSLIGGTIYAVGLIHIALLERYSENVTLTSWAGALHSALVSLGGPVSSYFVDRYSCRTTIVMSGVLYVIGYFTTAFAPNIYVAIFTCGIIAGMGGALGYTACIVAIGFNFQRRRNLAMGIGLSGVGIGILAMSPIMQLSRDYYGSTGFFIILSGISANIITFGMLCFPSKLELQTQQLRHRESAKQKAQQSKTCWSLRTYAKVLTNRSVMLLCLSMTFYLIGTFQVYLHLPKYTVIKGFSETQSSIIIALTGPPNVVGRIATGMVASTGRIEDIIIYSGSMGFVALVTVLFPFVSGYFEGQIIYALLFGLVLGSGYVVLPSVNIRVIGIEYMATALGFQFFFGGFGSILGPVLGGYIVDQGGTYDQSFIVAGVMVFLGGIFGALTACLPKGQSPGVHRGEEIKIECSDGLLSGHELAGKSSADNV